MPMMATSTTSKNIPMASEVVYQLLCQASWKEDDDFVYFDSEDDTGSKKIPYAASVKTLVEGKVVKRSQQLWPEILPWFHQSLQISRQCDYAGPGISWCKGYSSGESSGLAVPRRKNLFYRLLWSQEGNGLTRQVFIFERFDRNRSPAILSHPSPFTELLLGMTKMGITWGKLTRAARYALLEALRHEMGRYNHDVDHVFDNVYNVDSANSEHNSSGVDLNGQQLPSMNSAVEVDVQQHVMTSTKWTRSRTIFPLVSLLGLLKTDYSEFPLDLRESFEDCLILSLNSPPPFFSLANTALSMARMNLHISDMNPTLQETLILCIVKSMHTVRRSVYWKLLAGISSMGFRWPSMDVRTRETVEAPCRSFQ